MANQISVIFGYRNRGIVRVKNCLDSLKNQSYKDFEVVFIDYGSDEKIAVEIKNLVSSYPFASYYYNYTKDMPWNRAHALNTGVRIAKNEFILFGDIDLIYSPDVLNTLAEQVSDTCQIYSTVYFLPEGLTKIDEIMKSDWQSIPSSDENGKGGVHLIAKRHLEKIRGYDEYYSFWGVEDRDLYSRLDQLGIKSRWIDQKQYPVFHQWHPDVSGAKKGFFPDRWWESMNIHFGVNKNILIRNDDQWGKIYNEIDRKVFQAKIVKFNYKTQGNWFYRGMVGLELIESLQELKENECLSVTIERKNKSGKKLYYTNSLIKTILPKFKLVFDGITPFAPNRDLIYHIWRLIKDEKMVSDYSIIEEDNLIIIKIMKRI